MLRKEFTDELLETEDYRWFSGLLIAALIATFAWVIDLKLDLIELQAEKPQAVFCTDNYCIINKTKYRRAE